jgi:RNA polymerase sigma-70 factor (ECF subfamily)
LFRDAYPGLFRFAYRLLNSRELAEEIVQDVFLDLWRRRDVVDPCSVARAYLYTATRHAAISAIRRSHVEARAATRDDIGVGITHGMPSSDAAAAAEASDLDEAIARAVESLPDRCRLVYTLSRREQLSYAAIAAALGISVKTVEAQMGRAFRILRTRLASYLAALLLAALGAGGVGL